MENTNCWHIKQCNQKAHYLSWFTDKITSDGSWVSSLNHFSDHISASIGIVRPCLKKSVTEAAEGFEEWTQLDWWS